MDQIYKEKLQTIKDNVPKIYETGRNDFGYKYQAQGELVTINNIHPLEKTVKVNLSSADITDFSEVKVNVRGKNLVDFTKPDVSPTGGRFEVLDENTFRCCGLIGHANAETAFIVYAPQGIKINISFEYELGGVATGTWFVASPFNTAFGNGSRFTLDSRGYVKLSFARKGGSNNDKTGWVDIKNFQVEIGTTATEYEPYQETEYTANADGTVENVKSISPIMNISTDTAGVIITAECFKDAQKEIESLTTAIALTGGN